MLNTPYSSAISRNLDLVKLIRLSVDQTAVSHSKSHFHPLLHVALPAPVYLTLCIPDGETIRTHGQQKNICCEGYTFTDYFREWYVMTKNNILVHTKIGYFCPLLLYPSSMKASQIFLRD